MIIALIPAYNEEKYIGSVVLMAGKWVDSVIVCDDGSTDKTAHIAGLAGAEVIANERNQGYGNAVKRLLSRAQIYRPEITVLLDGDMQHNPNDIPLLVNEIQRGNDLVIGARNGNTDCPFYRRCGLAILRSVTNRKAGLHLTDTESGFRAFSRHALEVLELKSDGMTLSSEMVILAARNNLKITEVAVKVIYHRDGSTINPFTHGVGILRNLLK